MIMAQIPKTILGSFENRQDCKIGAWSLQWLRGAGKPQVRVKIGDWLSITETITHYAIDLHIHDADREQMDNRARTAQAVLLMLGADANIIPWTTKEGEFTYAINYLASSADGLRHVTKPVDMLEIYPVVKS